MRGVRAAVGLEHVVGVAVIGGDHARAAGLVDGVDHLLQAPVDRLDRLHRGRDHAGVADHVGVREVDDPELGRVRAPSAHERVAASGALIAGL